MILPKQSIPTKMKFTKQKKYKNGPKVTLYFIFYVTLCRLQMEYLKKSGRKKSNHTHDQIKDYLKRNKLLYIYQSGFRANHSADACLSRLMDLILNYAGNGLIDDTLNHKPLIEKIKCMSF